MKDETTNIEELLRRAKGGGAQAMAELFAHYRTRLRQMVRLRLDRRLQGQVDPSDVLDQAYLDFTGHVPEYVGAPGSPFFLWLRLLTGQKVVDAHRQHLGMVDASQEVSLYRGALPQASSISLAAQLLGRMTSASEDVHRAEMQTQVQEVLNTMDLLDREVLVLRHFEMLGNDEAAAVLDISKAVASNRYIRALKRLKELLAALPGFSGTNPK